MDVRAPGTSLPEVSTCGELPRRRFASSSLTITWIPQPASPSSSRCGGTRSGRLMTGCRRLRCRWNSGRTRWSWISACPTWTDSRWRPGCGRCAEFERTLIVGSSGYSRESDRQRADEVGINLYFVKPFDPWQPRGDPGIASGVPRSHPRLIPPAPRALLVTLHPDDDGAPDVDLDHWSSRFSRTCGLTGLTR